jgi:hypothetical protein
VAALPPAEKRSVQGQFDGRWTLSGQGTGCARSTWSFAFSVANGFISGRMPFGPLRGSVGPSGRIRFTHPSSGGDLTNHYSGTLAGTSGSGTLQVAGGTCVGTFTVRRQ